MSAYNDIGNQNNRQLTLKILNFQNNYLRTNKLLVPEIPLLLAYLEFD